jgi:hypothetical protein
MSLFNLFLKLFKEGLALCYCPDRKCGWMEGKRAPDTNPCLVACKKCQNPAFHPLRRGHTTQRYDKL